MAASTSRVVVVLGPTATGKSALGIELAHHLDGEIINADSMQLYEGMDIGTAKLSLDERQGVVHHLLDIWPVTRTASVADYQRRARAAIADIAGRNRVPIVVGGSGLYLRAVIDDMSFPGTDGEVRARFEAELADVGAAALHAKLAAFDPTTAASILPTNGRKIVRALEVAAIGGGAFTGLMPPYDSVYDAVSDRPRPSDRRTRPTAHRSGRRHVGRRVGRRGAHTRRPSWLARGRDRAARAWLQAGARDVRWRPLGRAGTRANRAGDEAVRSAPTLVVSTRPADQLAGRRRQRRRSRNRVGFAGATVGLSHYDAFDLFRPIDGNRRFTAARTVFFSAGRAVLGDPRQCIASVRLVGNRILPLAR